MQSINYQNRELDESEQTIAIKYNKEGILPGPTKYKWCGVLLYNQKDRANKTSGVYSDVQIMYEE